MAQFLLKGAMNNDQGGDDTGGGKTTPQTSTTPSATGGPIKITGAKSFDPPPGSGDEHPEDVANTYDGKLSTTWTTMSYSRANLGGEKPGVGIIYNLGTPTSISKVTVTLKGDGTSVQVMVPKSDPSKSPSTVSGWKEIATEEEQPEGAVTLTASAPTETQYVLVWLTELPKERDSSKYRGEISEVSIQR